MSVCVCESDAFPVIVSCLTSGIQEGRELYLFIQAWVIRREGEMVKRGHLFTQLKKTPGDTAKTKELKVLVPLEFKI